MSLPSLSDYRGDRIDMVCKRCDRHGDYARKDLVKKFGARAAFIDIKRRMTIGCDRAGTDTCEAMFPCLLNVSVLIKVDGHE